MVTTKLDYVQLHCFTCIFTTKGVPNGVFNYLANSAEQ